MFNLRLHTTILRKPDPMESVNFELPSQELLDKFREGVAPEIKRLNDYVEDGWGLGLAVDVHPSGQSRPNLPIVETHIAEVVIKARHLLLLETGIEAAAAHYTRLSENWGQEALDTVRLKMNFLLPSIRKLVTYALSTVRNQRIRWDCRTQVLVSFYNWFRMLRQMIVHKELHGTAEPGCWAALAWTEQDVWRTLEPQEDEEWYGLSNRSF